MDEANPIPYGYCHCGCGEKAPIAPKTYGSKGIRQGEPFRYVASHNRRKTPHDYVIDAAGCWLWQRWIAPNGYGYGWDGRAQREAHRIYYERHVGPIPEGLHIDHLCRVRACVNPDHLEAVTVTENNRRCGVARDAQTGRFLPAT